MIFQKQFLLLQIHSDQLHNHYKIQIKHQRSKNRELFRRIRRILMDGLEPLSVIRRQADKNGHPEIRKDKIGHCGIKKHIHDRRDNKPDQRHETKTPDRGQLFFSDPTVKAHPSKRHGCDKKGQGNRCGSIEQKHGSDRDAIERCINKKSERGSLSRHLFEARGKP